MLLQKLLQVLLFLPDLFDSLLVEEDMQVRCAKVVPGIVVVFWVLRALVVRMALGIQVVGALLKLPDFNDLTVAEFFDELVD